MTFEHLSDPGLPEPGPRHADDDSPVPLDVLPDPPEPRIDTMWRNISAARLAARRRRWIIRSAAVAAAAVVLALLRVPSPDPAGRMPAAATGAPKASSGDYAATVTALEAAMAPYWSSLPPSTAEPLRRSLAEVRAAVVAVDRELRVNPDSLDLAVMQARYQSVHCDVLRQALDAASAMPRSAGRGGRGSES